MRNVFALALLAAIGATPAFADFVTIPANLAGVEGATADTTPLGLDGTARLQIIYGSSTLGGLNYGDVITGLTFRVEGGQSSVPAQLVSLLEIRMSTSANAPGSASLTFASNRGANEAIVRPAAPFTINAGDFPGGSTPNAFGVTIPFTTPYIYAGGPLLVEYAYNGWTTGRLSDDSAFGVDGLELFGSSFGATTAFATEDNVFPIQFQVTPSTPVPATLLLAACGLPMLVIVRRRRRA